MGKYFTFMCVAAHFQRTSSVFPQLKLSQQIKTLHQAENVDDLYFFSPIFFLSSVGVCVNSNLVEPVSVQWFSISSMVCVIETVA